MPSNSGVTDRITSENIYIEFLPCSTVEATHVQKLYFDSAVDGGTFKLWVNGEETAAITFSDTEATLVTNVDAALDALPNLEAAEIALTGSDIADMTLTASANGFYRIYIVEGAETTLTQTTPNSNPKLQTEVTTQGAVWTQISRDISSVDWEVTAETVDVTAISEYERTEIPVAESVSGTISTYRTSEGTSEVPLMLFAGGWGVIRIFPEGKVLGKGVITFRALIETQSDDAPDHEKMEQEFSFMRQGKWINRPSSIWRG